MEFFTDSSLCTLVCHTRSVQKTEEFPQWRQLQEVPCRCSFLNKDLFTLCMSFTICMSKSLPPPIPQKTGALMVFKQTAHSAHIGKFNEKHCVTCLSTCPKIGFRVRASQNHNWKPLAVNICKNNEIDLWYTALLRPLLAPG